MKQELDDALVRDFPNLYRDRNAPMTDTCMCWGFTCEDGWEPLIREVSEKLEPLCIGNNNRAGQVKQKFGGLRIYMDYDENISVEDRNKIFEITVDAQTKSWEICELCGNPGELRNVKHYVSVKCDDCFKLPRKNHWK